MADFNDFGLILQDFERPFRRNQLVLALQFSFKISSKNIYQKQSGNGSYPNLVFKKSVCHWFTHSYQYMLSKSASAEIKISSKNIYQKQSGNGSYPKHVKF